MQSYSRKKSRTTHQGTLYGTRAFEPERDCPICRAKASRLPIPHRRHPTHCPNNKKTKGSKSKSVVAAMEEERRLAKHFAAPPTEAEKGRAANMTRENVEAFFAPRARKNNPQSTTPAPTEAARVDPPMPQQEKPKIDLYNAVVEKVNNPLFEKEHSNNKAPLAMIALAGTVIEKIVRPDKGSLVKSFFSGLTLTVPPVDNCNNPHYHSIVGQKLLLVDWKRMFGIDITCPQCNQGALVNDRTNFSKNKILFPIFGLEGPPQWCMVQSMTCRTCKSRHHANDGEILCRVPAYAAYHYPVDCRYAVDGRNSHLSRSATDLFDLLLPTYGNGDLCSRLLCNAVNRAYLEKAASFFSYGKEQHAKNPSYCTGKHLQREGEHMRSYPPLGETIRDLYDKASNTSLNFWGISDHERHTREMQGVKCNLIFAQDHTHEVCKNYLKKKTLGMEALWDVSTETGK